MYKVFVHVAIVNLFLVLAWSVIAEDINTPTVNITKLVDGDTVKTNNETFRLAGYNTVERGKKDYYKQTAKLANYLIGKKVTIKRIGKDTRWNRTVAILFANGKCVNAQMRKYLKRQKSSGYNKYDYLSTFKNGQKQELIKCGIYF